MLNTSGASPPRPKSMRRNQEITYEWEREPDREAFKRIMFDSFANCYKDIPKEVLRVSNVEEWLSNHFSDEFLEGLKKDECVYRLVTAKLDGKPAGYALFDLSHCPEFIYISEMAVDPAYQRKGIGRGLVFSVLKWFPKIEKIVLITRKVNTQARQFYSSLGFQSTDYMENGYDPELYIGYDYTIEKKGALQ